MISFFLDKSNTMLKLNIKEFFKFEKNHIYTIGIEKSKIDMTSFLLYLS